MKFLKILIHKFLDFFLIFGIKISINKTNSNVDFEIIDKNSWIPYLNRKDNYYFDLYKEAIIKSQSVESDNFRKQLRFYSLMNIVNYAIKNINHEHFVECGCWKGHSTYIISKILEKNNFKKKFFVFDSFDGGLSSRNSEDFNTERYKKSNKNIIDHKYYFSSEIDKVKDLLKNFNFVELHKSWIPDKFKLIKDLKFSFIHIDVDLFEPTRDSIEFFYDKLIDGGIIVCDDYNHSDFPGGNLAIDNFLKNKKTKLFYEIPLGGCIIIK